MSARAWKRLKWALAALALAALLPVLPAGLLRGRLQRALEQSLGRKVEIGAVHLTLLPGVLPGPGFTLDQVLIHEDERAGIEPFAYVESLGASIRLLSVLRGRLEFGALNLEDATINLVKSAAGPWNFQHLLSGAATTPRAMPSLRMRGGRVNLKFGDTKSVFYFNDADLDIRPSLDGSFEFRFGGAPSRTDRAAQEFGRLFVRGSSSASQMVSVRVELERSELEETLRWIVPGVRGIHGSVSLDAQLSGPSSRLEVRGSLEVGDIHRWDLLPAEGSRWRMSYSGTLDLPSQRLELAGVSSDPEPPLSLRLQARDWLTRPRWDAAADVQAVPLSTLVKLATHMGAVVPPGVVAEGSVSAVLRYDQAAGLAGRVELKDASLTLAGAAPLRARSAPLVISGGMARLERTVVEAGENHSAEVEALFPLAAPPRPEEPRQLDLRIATRGLDVALMRSFAVAAIPVIQETPVGTWRGVARYRSGGWTGAFELSDARFAVEGLAQPVEIGSAAVALNATRVAITKLQARSGSVAFTGEYRRNPAAERPHTFALSIPEADAEELRKLLAPTLERGGSFLSRTLRLGSAPRPPEWLIRRRAEGSVAIEALSLGGKAIGPIGARLIWDGTAVTASALRGEIESGRFAGELEVDLAGRTPRLHFEGKLEDLPYRGGFLTLEGSADAGAETFRAGGTLRGRSIVFSPDAEFRAVAGEFETQGLGPQAKWKLSNLEITQGTEVLNGSASTQSDGKLVLELAGKGRPLRLFDR